jgi:hypothetical protein
MAYLRSNPLAEHNSGIALSSKEIPQNTGTGNMYQGQASLFRAVVARVNTIHSTPEIRIVITRMRAVRMRQLV